MGDAVRLVYTSVSTGAKTRQVGGGAGIAIAGQGWFLSLVALPDVIYVNT